MTDPFNPVYVGELPRHEGTRANVWRDIKTYADHAYIVADAAGFHGMQVFDLTLLRSVTTPPVTFAETAHYAGFGSAHNIVINEETGFAYAVGVSAFGETCGGGLHMINIQIPETPRFAGCFAHPGTGRAATGYTHDAQCVVYHGPDTDYQGQEICFGANETAISIADVTVKGSPVPIASASYPDYGYVHQGWLTEDHRYFFQDDELDELGGKVDHTRTIVWDVTDLDDPQVLTEYMGPTTSIDHNLYIKGNLMYQANYTSGLRVLDIRDVAHPVEVAFFDTTPQNTGSFGGTWSNYPYFESGNVIVGSDEEGLFVLQPVGAALTATEAPDVPAAFSLNPAFPNPFHTQTTVSLTLHRPQRVTVTVYDVLGRTVTRLHEGVLPAGPQAFVFDASGLPGGTYFVRATGETFSATETLTRVR